MQTTKNENPIEDKNKKFKILHLQLGKKEAERWLPQQQIIHCCKTIG